MKPKLGVSTTGQRLRVLFHDNGLGLRGTSVSLFDYAYFGREILGIESIICAKSEGQHTPEVVQKFRSEFPVYFYHDLDDLQSFADSQRIDVFYVIKSGENDGLSLSGCRNAVHCVFKHYEPHGDVYAYVSAWLAQEASGGKAPHVPHIVYLPPISGDLRAELGISPEARVFGCHGGSKNFNVSCAVKSVLELAAFGRQDIHFVFMNMEPRVRGTFQKLLKSVGYHRNRLHFLPGTSDMETKAKFIQTCDAMLHARKLGETFGIAIGEFAILGKPILTYCDPEVKDRNHYQILGQDGNYYHDKCSLKALLTGPLDRLQKCSRYQTEFCPETVMAKFYEVFLQG